MTEVGNLIDETWYGKLTTREHPCRFIKLGKVGPNWRLLVPFPPTEDVNPRNMKDGQFLLATYASPKGDPILEVACGSDRCAGKGLGAAVSGSHGMRQCLPERHVHMGRLPDCPRHVDAVDRYADGRVTGSARFA